MINYYYQSAMDLGRPGNLAAPPERTTRLQICYFNLIT